MPLGVPRGENANTIGHVLSAYARMPDTLGVDAGQRVIWAIGRLEALRSPGFDEPCWGYHFDVETRYFFYSRETPNTIATAFAAHGLLDAAERRADSTGERALALAVGAGEFFLRRIEATAPGAGTPGAFLGYFPGDRTPIHNASLLGASVLARLAARDPGREDFAQRARDAVAYAVAMQRPDGSWPYSEGPDGMGDWVDNFHTGYVLDALLRCGEALGLDDALCSSPTTTSRWPSRSTPAATSWLNNPLRPYEACGTSGMKAALNGGLNLSILDGWWDRVVRRAGGERLGNPIHRQRRGGTDKRDDIEAAALYDLIENDVAPRFYDTDHDGVPVHWVAMLRHTLKLHFGPKVLATRMVRDYTRQLYAPAAENSRALNSDFEGARALAAWKASIHGAWSGREGRAHRESGGSATRPRWVRELTVRALRVAR